MNDTVICDEIYLSIYLEKRGFTGLKASPVRTGQSCGVSRGSNVTFRALVNSITQPVYYNFSLSTSRLAAQHSTSVRQLPDE